MTIVIIDGQGGRVGALLIEALRAAGITTPHRLLCVGSNALATAAMLRAGADQGATGENPVRIVCREADVICGPIGILMSDAMMGEITPEMAVAVGSSRAHRVLLPMERCGTSVAGVESAPLSKLVEMAVQQVKTCIGMPQSQSTER